MTKRPFLISALVDFPDDCREIVFTRDLLAQLMDRLRWAGVRRVYWIYYQEGFWKVFSDMSPGRRPTLQNLGEPTALARRLAHERAMEFYAVIKPYETGISTTTVRGSPENAGRPGLPRIGGLATSVDPWVMARPELRLRGRRSDMPVGVTGTPVERIQLRQKDMAPIRIEAENLEIWTSADNYGYQRRDLAFTLNEGVEKAERDVFDMSGNPVTSRGEPVRVLELRGLSLTDPFVAVTTRLADEDGTFRNTATEMVRAFGPGDQPLPVVVASHQAVWRPERDLRTGDLQYDGGLGDTLVCLDVDNRRATAGKGRTQRDGVIAFARGRNQYVPGSLCEAYPEVQAYWLDWVGECIAAGVDGVDVRVSNHSAWTDRPELYGFNEPVLAEYERRYEVDPDVEPYDPSLLAALRGEIYDRFLRAVKRRLSAAGKPLQVHLEVESFRPDAALGRRRSQAGLMSYNWRSWLRTGLADEATLFGREWLPERILADSLCGEMLEEAVAADVPVHLSHPVWHGGGGPEHAERLEQAYQCAGLSGYTFYETAALYDGRELGPDGRLQFRPGLIEGIRKGIEDLGLL